MNIFKGAAVEQGKSGQLEITKITETSVVGFPLGIGLRDARLKIPSDSDPSHDLHARRRPPDSPNLFQKPEREPFS